MRLANLSGRRRLHELTLSALEASTLRPCPSLPLGMVGQGRLERLEREGMSKKGGEDFDSFLAEAAQSNQLKTTSGQCECRVGLRMPPHGRSSRVIYFATLLRLQ
jgi:hypothetical protein